MTRRFENRRRLLDAMAYVFLYSADPSSLDSREQRTLRDDIVSVLRGIEEEISQSTIQVQRNWFTRAKEKAEEGLELFDQSRLTDASRALGQAEDIFRSGVTAHKRKTDFIIGSDGVVRKQA